VATKLHPPTKDHLLATAASFESGFSEVAFLTGLMDVWRMVSPSSIRAPKVSDWCRPLELWRFSSIVGLCFLLVTGCQPGAPAVTQAPSASEKMTVSSSSPSDPLLQQPPEATLPLAKRCSSVPPTIQVATNPHGLRLVLVPAGRFRMGSPADDTEARPDELPQIEVEIPAPFELGQTEVTRGQFRTFVKATGYKTLAEREKGGFAYNVTTKRLEPDPDSSWQSTGFEQTDDHPVVNVAVEDAEAFCRWLTQEEDKTYRLPTEIEWEYACRGGTNTKWSTGNDLDSLKTYCNLCDVNLERMYPFADWSVDWNDGYPFTAPVATYRPNPFGLFDMHGNVFEWCADPWPTKGYDGRPLLDQDEPVTPGSRLVRGGSFLSLTMFTRSADRVGLAHELRNAIVGFRVLREHPASATTPAGESPLGPPKGSPQ
jgi:sulfatase modifying factor 1